MKSTHRAFAVLLPLVITAVFSACKNDPAGPEPKNPREYTWTIDTLAYPGSYQTLMKDIYGASPHDVWAVGHNSNARGKMYHFDGKQWKDVGLYTSQGGNIKPSINLTAIFGFSSSNIWAVGETWSFSREPPYMYFDSSLIIHFDGKEWSEWKLDRGGMLQSIWGSGPTNIWAGGFNTLYHFDGTQWKLSSVWIPPEGIQFISIAGTGPSDVYMTGYRNDVIQPIDTLAYFLYRFDGIQWSVIDSSIRTVEPAFLERFGGTLYAIGGDLLSAGFGVYRKTTGGWSRMVYSSWSLEKLHAASVSNIYAVGQHSSIYHFNGTDWYRFPQFTDALTMYSSVWTNGSEVFVVGYDGLKTFVLHGR